jgi:hypothetical protein
VLKGSSPPGIRDWKRYVAKFLRNKASNWIRGRRAQERRTIPIVESSEESCGEPFVLEAALPSPGEYSDLGFIFSQLWGELDSGLRQLWEVLLEEKGNQAQVARRLGRHRNTVRLQIGKIRQALAAHELQPVLHPGRGMVRSKSRLADNPMTRSTRGKLLLIPSELLRALSTTRLSGTQCRILLWVMRRAMRRKQRTTPFSWYRIAQELSIDRGGVCRAGRRLLDANLLFIQEDKIGLQRVRRTA